MKSSFYHLQTNIDFKNVSFYKDLLLFLGWSVIFEDKTVAGFKSGEKGDLWFLEAPKKVQTDYDQIGVNHISIRVQAQDDIDATTEFLKTKGVSPLFNTPRHRPEFTSEEKETYYQIMFESPDQILFEVVYVGPKK